MASLLEKIQTLISADLNQLVDSATRASEPAMFRQHLRDLQQMQEQLTEEIIDEIFRIIGPVEDAL